VCICSQRSYTAVTSFPFVQSAVHVLAASLAKLCLARADQEALAAVPMASNEARKELAGTIFRIARKVIVERVMLCRDCGRSI
jgi:hypothetical protein